jgi:hypothetical protein
MYGIAAYWVDVFIVHADEQGETSECARSQGTVWKGICHRALRISTFKTPGESFAVIQVLAIVLNAKRDTQNLRALLHGVRVKDNFRNKLKTSYTAQSYCKNLRLVCKAGR